MLLLTRCVKLRWRWRSQATFSAAAAAASAFTAAAAPVLCQQREASSLDSAAQPRQRRRPPLFGAHLPPLSGGTRAFPRSQPARRDLSYDSGADVEGGGGTLDEVKPDDDDCPICRKYGRGPCGELFWAWLRCADANPGKDEATGEELHLSRCEKFAVPLARCLEEHEELYNGPLLEDEEGEGAEMMEELRVAWSDMVKELESGEGRSRRHFPASIRPEMEVRYKSMEGMAAFSAKNEQGADLVLAYVKDQDGMLLGAGSREDINSGGGIMRFGIKNDTKSVTACALYGEKKTLIYTCTVVLPPKEDS